MKRSFLPLVLMIIAAIVFATPQSAATVQDHGPSAFGTGQFRFINPITSRGEDWSFSFEAEANKNGSARGRAEFDNLTAQTQVTVRINCLSVDSAFAVLSGEVLHSNDPNLPKLDTVIFAASDAELLPMLSFDTITPLFSSGGRTCHDTQPLTILEVDNGDIEIQP